MANHAAKPTKSLSVRFGPDVRQAVDAAAKADRRSAASLIELATVKELQARGFLPVNDGAGDPSPE